MNNIARLAPFILSALLSFTALSTAVADEPVSSVPGKGIKLPASKTYESDALCQSFVEYALISRDFSKDQEISSQDASILTSKFILRSEEFQSLTEDRQDSWIEFMTQASLWGHKNKGIEIDSFINQSKLYCDDMMDAARVKMSESALRCHAVAEFTIELYPFYDQVQDVETITDVLSHKLELNDRKIERLRDALVYLDRNKSSNADITARRVYKDCLKKGGSN